MADLFDAVTLEVRKEILHLEAREFGDIKYHSDSEIGGNALKWIPNPGKFKKKRPHFLHSKTLHRQMETLLNLGIQDK